MPCPDANLPPRQKRKYSKTFWVISLGIVFILFGLAGLGFYVDKQFNDGVANIQTNLIEAATAKIIGNSIKTKKQVKGETMDAVQTLAMTAADNLTKLTVPDDLKNYQAVALVWSLRIAAAAGQPADWANLKNQPDPFPLNITDTRAANLLEPLRKNIADLKTIGAKAIQDKDRAAMRQVAAKLLVQNHFLNAILHSQKDTVSAISPVLADAGLPSVPNVKGVDVTCSVCNYPDVYKVSWTDSLRKQYGCDSRCHKQNQPVQEEVKYAESIASYSYSDSKRTVCTSTNNGGSFCAEKAAQATNELIDAAIGFADGSRTFTAEQWNSAVAYATGEIGTPPSWPSAEGGHKEGGMGTVKQGEPDSQPSNKSNKANCDDLNEACRPALRLGGLAGELGGGGRTSESEIDAQCKAMYQDCLKGQ